VTPSPSIERTSHGKPWSAGHVKRSAHQKMRSHHPAIKDFERGSVDREDRTYDIVGSGFVRENQKEAGIRCRNRYLVLWRGALGFWRCGGWDFFDADGVGPFGDEGITFFHRHSGILRKHLWVFAATPGEIVEEVLPADAVRAGWAYTLAWQPLIRKVRSIVVKGALLDLTLLQGLSLHRCGMGGFYWWPGGQVQNRETIPSSLWVSKYALLPSECVAYRAVL
jgi:hypothetical protein